MQTEYFQGKDGYIWWHGVVEDRKDPLFLGRCRVRILGWHTENKAELPTDMLPWAQVLMPITSASQTGVGQAPVGPVEGTWVMGFYRDGELAQEPVMIGTLPGIPERFARQNTGFYDSRLDTPSVNKNTVTTSGDAKITGTKLNLQSFPYPPKSVEYKAGQEAIVTSYTHDERIALQSKSLYPREVNRPTTPIYARGKEDSTTKVIEGTGTTNKTDTKSVSSGVSSIIANKNRNLLSQTLTISFTPNEVITKTTINNAKYFDDIDSFSATNDIKDINQPPSAYDAEYPFNHVYESESGHLLEIDDTPSKERLHWYHRSGSFTEFSPAGNRIDRTVSHRYNMTTGNQETIIQGDEIKGVAQDGFLDVGGKLTMASGKDMKLISESGNVIVDAPTLNTVISGKNVLVAASDTLVLKGGVKVVRDDDSAVDVVKGDYQMQAQGGYEVNSGKISLGSLGATSISSFGPLTQVVTGNSEETIANSDIIFGNLNAKLIKALLGKIVLECTEPFATGGIDLNMGPFGTIASIKMLPGGLITVTSSLGTVNVTGTSGVSMTSAGPASVVGTAATSVGSSGTALTSVNGAFITVGGSSSPALLAKDFLKLFAEHNHPSSVGPTGPLSPQFASKLIQTMSKKVFLS